MGRVGEVIIAHPADRRQDEGAARQPGRVTRPATTTCAPPLYRQIHDQPGDHARHRAPRSARSRGKLADLWCCGSRPSSASSPSLIIKAGMIAAARWATQRLDPDAAAGALPADVRCQWAGPPRDPMTVPVADRPRDRRSLATRTGVAGRRRANCRGVRRPTWC